MQIRQQLLSNIILLNDDLHEQTVYVRAAAAALFYGGKSQTGDKCKEECVNKAFHFICCTALCTPYGGEKHFCRLALIFSEGCLHNFPSNQPGVYDSVISCCFFIILPPCVLR